jgi:uncharacterized protein (TIGR00369 family)
MTYDLDTITAFFASSPFMVDLGVVPTAVSPGRLATQLQLASRHRQHTGVVHAGVMASMADHTMGAAAQTLAPQGHWILTAELKTSLLRGATGDRLSCEAVVIKPGRSLSFTEAEVFAEAADGRRTLVMKASATMAVVPKRD